METIRIANLSKKFRVYFEKPALIKSILPFLLSQGKPQEFWALRDINFGCQAGECVGIIGPNGSGKSTFLTILAGITYPTLGTVHMAGQVSSLLSLGAGFHPELTGQENIYLNAAILGFSKESVDRIYEEIVDFSELGKFMTAKLATYSAGMNMRLGFSIATRVPFDILLIDEVLSVGDMHFQDKSLKYMKNILKGDGKKSILMVSHMPSQLEEICSRVIWFEHGNIEMEGKPDEVIKVYTERYKEKYKEEVAARRKKRVYLGRKVGPARITADAGVRRRRIPSTLFGSNVCWLNDGRFLHLGKGRLHPLWLRELKKLGFGFLRYPGDRGGDFFHWEHALGRERPKQPCGFPNTRWIRRVLRSGVVEPMRVPGDMWVEPPGFGPDECASLARELGSDVLLVLNVATGTPEEAAGFVRHMEARGCRVRHVELGHELYHDDYHDIGATFPWSPEQYGEKVEDFSRALREYNPDLKIIAQGCMDTGTFTRYRHPDWIERLLRRSGRWIDFLSLHNTEAPVLNVTPAYSRPLDSVAYEALLAAPAYVADNLERVKALLGDYEGRTGRVIRPAVTHYRAHFDDVPKVLHGAHRVTRRERGDKNLARNCSLSAALYEALLLHIFLRDPSIELAARSSLFHPNYASLWKIRGFNAESIPTSQYAVQLYYSRLAGKILVQSDVESDTFDSKPIGIVPAQRGVPYLDCVAVYDEGAEKLTLCVVNRHHYRAIKAHIRIKNFAFRRFEVLWLNGEKVGAVNAFDSSSKVLFGSHNALLSFSPDKEDFSFEFPPHSIYFLTLRNDEWL